MPSPGITPLTSDAPPVPVEATSASARWRLLARALPLLTLVEVLITVLLLTLYRQTATWPLLSLLLPLMLMPPLRFMALARLQRGRAPEQARGWLLASLLLSSLSLSGSFLLLNPPALLGAAPQATLQGLHLCLLLGAAVVGIACLGPLRVPACLHASLLVLPAAAHLLHQDAFQALALGMLLFWVFGLVAIHRVHDFAMRSLTLRQRNEHLIRYLDQARTDAEALNDKLALEIQARQAARQKLQESRDQLESTVQARTRELADTNHVLATTSQRLHLALDVSNLCLWDWDVAAGDVFTVNFHRLLGRPAQANDPAIRDPRPLIHADDFPLMREAVIQHFRGQTPQYRATYRMRHGDGSWHWIEDEGRVVSRDAGGRALRMIGIRRDVTRDQQAREQLRLSATVFENASEAIFILDRDLQFLTANQSFSRITGYTEQELQGRTIFDLPHNPANTELYRRLETQLERDGFWEGELQERRKNGELFPQWLQLSAVRDDAGELTHFVGMFSDLTRHKEAEERLRFLSDCDRLTGFANRTQFHERLHRTLTLTRLNRRKAALLYLDLDRFRHINDSLGHEIGDRLLKQVAERLRECGFPEEQLARVGGDEFTVTLPHCRGTETALAACDVIIGALRRPFLVEGHELLLGASLGVALFPDTAQDVQGLIRQADLAQQQAKHAGGNAARIYSPDMRITSVEQLNLETRLRKAIFQDEFEVHYQPKLDLRSHRIHGVEALVRWQHPERGLLPAREFVPLAEETGLISAIGERVLERACRQALQWHQDGLGDIHVSVNLSAHQLRKGNVVDIVSRILDSTGLPPHLLELELTESLIMEDLEKNTVTLKALRDLGIELSLDDFGTGYSSLSYLKRFPIHTLKIDRSFITELDHNPTDAAITRAIVELAHSLQLKVVAEGVETQAHLDILRGMDCDAVQGYLISRPVDERTLRTLLAEQVASRLPRTHPTS